MSLLVIKTSLFVILLAISCVMIFAGKLIVIMLHSKIMLFVGVSAVRARNNRLCFI